MRKVMLRASVASLALIAGQPVWGQTAQPVPPSPAGPAPAETMPPGAPTPDQAAPQTPTEGLGDIIVTAQRRSESLQRAAVAVAVVTPQQLTSAGVVTPATLNAAVPALSVQQAGGPNTSFFVRGVGNFTSNGYSDPAVAFNLDGVYLGRATSTTGTFFDLERIEVLKGPQGTLYGRNATGGAINVIPARPRIGETSASVAGSYGNYDAKDLEATLNLPLGERFALRVAGKVFDRDGYNDDGTSDEVGQAARIQLLGKVTDTLTVRLAADYSHQGGTGAGSSYIGSEQYTPGSPATATSPANYTFRPSGLGAYSGLLSTQGAAYFSRLVIPGSFINPAPLQYPRQSNHYWGTNAEITLETGAGSLVVIPAYREAHLDSLFNGPSFRAATVDEDDRQFSLEARFQAKRIGMFDALIGGYYFDEKILGNYTFNQYQIQTPQDFTSKTKSYAGFGRVTANLTDALRLVAGGRYTHDSKSFVATGPTIVELCVNAPPPFGPGCFGGPSQPTIDNLSDLPAPRPTIPGPAGAVPFGTSGNILFLAPFAANAGLGKSRFTYRLAAEYDVAPRSLLYASYETGYRSGGFSAAFGRETFTPEYIDAYTIGSKNRFLDNRLQFNVEAFYWKYRDQQVSHFGVDGNGNNAYFTENIGRSSIKGVDAEAQLLVTQHTLLRTNVQYLDNEVQRFTFTTLRGANSLPPVTGCAVTQTTANATPLYAVNCAGKPGYNSPRWSVNAGAEQTIPLDTVKIVLSGEARYRSNAVVGFDYLPQQNSGTNWTLDASVTFGATDDRWSITAFARNITKETYRTFVQFADTTGESLTGTFNPPRTYGVRAGYKF